MAQKDKELIDKLAVTIAELDKDRATTADLNEVAKTLTELVVSFMTATKAEKEAFFASAESRIDESISNALKTLSERVGTKLASITQPKDGYTPMKGVDYFDGVTPVKGVDYFDGETPDFEALVLAVLEQIPEQVQLLGEDMRNALEALPEGDKLSIDAIEGLREELDKKAKTTVFAGGSNNNITYQIRHDEFTMDGVATTVTLSYGVAAQGNAMIALRYQGQTLDHNTMYTVDGNKITLVGFTPENGTIISATYFG